MALPSPVVNDPRNVPLENGRKEVPLTGLDLLLLQANTLLVQYQTTAAETKSKNDQNNIAMGQTNINNMKASADAQSVIVDKQWQAQKDAEEANSRKSIFGWILSIATVVVAVATANPFAITLAVAGLTSQILGAACGSKYDFMQLGMAKMAEAIGNAVGSKEWGMVITVAIIALVAIAGGVATSQTTVGASLANGLKSVMTAKFGPYILTILKTIGGTASAAGAIGSGVSTIQAGTAQKTIAETIEQGANANAAFTVLKTIQETNNQGQEKANKEFKARIKALQEALEAVTKGSQTFTDSLIRTLSAV